MKYIQRLACDFRQAMDKAHDDGVFIPSTFFTKFPQRCCGDTCYLLAEYLLEHGLYTEYVCGIKGEQSHAWLVIVEENTPTPHKATSNPLKCRIRKKSNSYQVMLELIGNYEDAEASFLSPAYDLTGRTIIDITGDQFRHDDEFLCYNIPVYVGPMDSMHSLFEISDIHICRGLVDVGDYNMNRLSYLYSEIKKYL